jgi:prefoldin alpha subunit
MTIESANNNARVTEHSINEMVQESKLLESYFNDLDSRESLLHRLLEESRNSFEAIRELSSETETLSLVPLGIGVYVKSSIYPIERVLVNIGAGVVIEKKKDDAMNFIEHRIKEFEIAAKQLSSQKQQISHRLMEIQNTVNSYISQMQQPGNHGTNAGMPRHRQ